VIEHQGVLIAVGMATVISTIILATAFMRVGSYYLIARIMLIPAILGGILLGEMHVSGHNGDLFWPTIAYFGSVTLALIVSYWIRTD